MAPKYTLDQLSAAISGEYANGIQQMVNVTAAEVINTAAAQASAQVGRALSAFAAAYNSSMRRNRSTRIKKIHTQAAVRAQGAIFSAYTGRTRRNPSEPYRSSAPGKWKRDSNGAMERGLRSPEFFRATGTHLEFINKNAMDRAARQWYRLNFGAGAAAAATPQQGMFPMRILGRSAGALTLRGNTPSEGYMIPAGFWTPSGGGSEFVPFGYLRNVGTAATMGARSAQRTSASKKQMSIGFPGYNYLDAGMDDLAAGLGAGYTLLAEEWFREATTKNTGPVAFVISPNEAKKLLPSIERNVATLTRRGALRGFGNR